MKLIDSIKSLIYEQLDDFEDAEKLFGDDIKAMFNYYKKNDMLQELLSLLEDKPLKLIPTLLGTGNPKYEQLAWGLVNPYVRSDILKQGDKYILSLDDREDLAKLFWNGGYQSDGQDCFYVAEKVFREDLWDSWEDYDSGEMPEHIIETLTEENYQEFVTSLIENYGNEEIKNTRGEFDHWVEEDNLSDNPEAFILTPDRILGAAGDRYALTALVNCQDLSDFENVLTSAYDKAYNSVIISDYYNQYHKSVTDLLGEGKDVQRGKRMVLSKDGLTANVPIYKYEFDVTDKFWEVIEFYSQRGLYDEIQEYGWFDILRTIMDHNNYKGGLLCPKVDNYPDEENVDNQFNDIFIDELKWN